jgi:hypothetical protein
MNGMTLTFRSISSGNTNSDYMANELKVLQLTSAPTSTELPLPKDGGSRFQQIVGVCLQTYTASKPTMAVERYGTSALHVSSLAMLFIFAENKYCVLKRTLRVRLVTQKVIQ